MEYSSSKHASPLQELTCHMVSVLPATWQRCQSRLYPSQLKLVLDSVTLEGCKAELT